MNDHPHLDPQVAATLKQSAKDGGVFTRDVPPGSTVLVQTLNTLYTMHNHGELWIAQGGKHLPETTAVRVNGSTFGGSMIRSGFIGIGMRLELVEKACAGEHPRTVTTSPIQSITIRFAEGADVYADIARLIFGNRGAERIEDTKRFVYAVFYNTPFEHLAREMGLEPTRVQEIVDFLRFLEVPDGTTFPGT